MHGGQIVVQSGIATGSLFTIMFPLARTLYNKTIDSVENQVPIKTPLAISVANDLKRLANEGGVIFDDWKELDEAQLEKIKLMINDSLADDEEIIFTSSFEMD